MAASAHQRRDPLSVIVGSQHSSNTQIIVTRRCY
jgi:hypothetical protein